MVTTLEFETNIAVVGPTFERTPRCEIKNTLESGTELSFLNQWNDCPSDKDGKLFVEVFLCIASVISSLPLSRFSISQIRNP